MKKKKSDSEGLLFESSYIEIFGEKEAVLTGKNEIIELGETVLKIKCNEHRIRFEGEGLHILNYAYDGITLRGKIKKIEFERG